MFPRVTRVRHLKDYWLDITFSNGVQAQLDFRDRIVGRGGVFVPLEDVDYFRKVQVDAEVGTLVWPNDVDFCPDVLYSDSTGTPLPITESA